MRYRLSTLHQHPMNRHLLCLYIPKVRYVCARKSMSDYNEPSSNPAPLEPESMWHEMKSGRPIGRPPRTVDVFNPRISIQKIPTRLRDFMLQTQPEIHPIFVVNPPGSLSPFCSKPIHLRLFLWNAVAVIVSVSVPYITLYGHPYTTWFTHARGMTHLPQFTWRKALAKCKSRPRHRTDHVIMTERTYSVGIVL